MADKYYNKIVYGSNTLIDLTSDTIEAAYLLKPYTAHARSGAPITGTCTYDSNTTDATALSSEILSTKTAYVNKTKLTGSMPNNGAVSVGLTTTSQYTVPLGYHDGSGKVYIDVANIENFIANNIRKDVEILGITGTMDPAEGMNPQTKSATPTVNGFTVSPDADYNCLSSVVIAAIPYTESLNAQGGYTVTIAG